jgi:hypothetical protein
VVKGAALNVGVAAAVAEALPGRVLLRYFRVSTCLLP